MNDRPKYQGVIPDDLEDLKNVDDEVQAHPGDVLTVDSVTDSGRPIWKSATPTGGGGGGADTAVSVNPSGLNVVQSGDTNVHAALSRLDGAVAANTATGSTNAGSIAAHISDTTDAHADTAVSVNPSGLVVIQGSDTTVHLALARLDGAMGSTSGTSFPSSPFAGQVHLRTDVNGGTTYRWNGSSWVQAAPGLTEAPVAHADRHRPGGADALWKNAYKTADSAAPVNNSTTFVSDPDLTLAFLANEVWRIQMTVLYQSLDTADFKQTFSIPAGATGMYALVGPAGTIGASAVGDGNWTPALWSGQPQRGGAPGGGNCHLMIDGLLIMGGTAGSLTYRFAQATAIATDTKLLAGSFMMATRIS